MKKLLFIVTVLMIFVGCKHKEAEVNRYTVTFESQGGSAVSPVLVQQGAKVPKPQDPTRSGFTFKGWYKEQAGVLAWNFDQDVVMQNTTLYASWTDSRKLHIYVAGAIPNAEGKVTACYWNDGQIHSLSEGFSDANTILVMDTSVYVSGVIAQGGNQVPCYWKDGKVEVLSVPENNGYTTKMCSSDKDIYISGVYYLANIPHACYWKNGERVELPDSKYKVGNGIFVSSKGDVYVGGGRGVYWKNRELIQTTPGDLVQGFFESDQGLYFYGGYGSVHLRPACWKDSISIQGEIELENVPWASGYTHLVGDLFVSGKETYATYSPDLSANPVLYALYWKNGKIVTLSSTNGVASSIKVFEQDVYVAGTNNQVDANLRRAVYWKNEEMIPLHDDRSKAVSIYVVRN